jgi:hypothetical protein
MKTSPHNLFLHADGDSFFVACEVAKEPQYKGKPVVVGGDRGVAVAMSAEAKKLGVTRGMPVFQIKRDFPTVIVLPHNFDLYNHISRQVYEILCSYLSLVEIYSIDECFALVKPSDVVFAGSPEKLLTEIKHEIQETCGVTYSFGLARTKALAKTASKLNKPNGLVMLLDSEDEKRGVLVGKPLLALRALASKLPMISSPTNEHILRNPSLILLLNSSANSQENLSMHSTIILIPETKSPFSQPPPSNPPHVTLALSWLSFLEI